ncbi:MAG: tryptophan-rich sensory protein [Lachnospiraceae bacterium]|nr:tryptophan-rich sensory protein [Lachnospiraceae bacterium]
MKMRSKIKTLAVCIAIPLIVGGISALISRNSMETFQMLDKPALSPPGALFPIVWTVLYILMGIASFLILTSDEDQEAIQSALAAYALQLAVNFFWSIFFFNLGWYLFAFFWLVLLWLLIVVTIQRFTPISLTAAYLMLPYLLWVTFAGYLNLSIYLLQ